MIEFMEDGAFAAKSGEKPVTLRILGLGRTGIRVVDHLVLRGLRPFDMWSIDSCRETLEGSCAREKFLLGEDKLRGLGARGELEPAREVAEASEAVLRDAVNGCDYVIAVTGLGGATGSALAEKLIEVAATTQTRVVIFAAMPFSFEGMDTQRQALSTLKRLRAEADSVLVFSSERFGKLAVAEEDVRKGLVVMSRLMAKSVEAIAQIICREGLIQLSFSDIRSLYGRMEDARQPENTWAAFAEVRAEDGPVKLVEEALASDLLNDDVWQQANHAMLCLSGGRDLSLVDVQNVIRELQKFLPANFPVATAANLEVKCVGKLRLTMLLAATEVTRPVDESLLAGRPRNEVRMRERLVFNPQPLIDESVFDEAIAKHQSNGKSKPEPILPQTDSPIEPFIHRELPSTKRPEPQSASLDDDFLKMFTQMDNPICKEEASPLVAESGPEPCLDSSAGLAEEVADGGEPEEMAESMANDATGIVDAEIVSEKLTPLSWNADSPAPEIEAPHFEILGIENDERAAEAEAAGPDNAVSEEESAAIDIDSVLEDDMDVIDNDFADAVEEEESEYAGGFHAVDDYNLDTDDGAYIEQEEDEEALVMANRTGLPKEPRNRLKKRNEQVELAFESPSRGRFDNTAHSLHNGEDLDLPTFRRRHLKIRL